MENKEEEYKCERCKKPYHFCERNRQGLPCKEEEIDGRGTERTERTE